MPLVLVAFVVSGDAAVSMPSLAATSVDSLLCFGVSSDDDSSVAVVAAADAGIKQIGKGICFRFIFFLHSIYG